MTVGLAEKIIKPNCFERLHGACVKLLRFIYLYRKRIDEMYVLEMNNIASLFIFIVDIFVLIEMFQSHFSQFASCRADNVRLSRQWGDEIRSGHCLCVNAAQLSADRQCHFKWNCSSHLFEWVFSTEIWPIHSWILCELSEGAKNRNDFLSV